MAACANIEFEIDEVSKPDSDNSSNHNVKHSENNQDDLPKNSFFWLHPNWSKKEALPYSFHKLLLSTQTSNITITDECSVPSSDNETQ